jgi:hypothetical protein
MAGVVAKDCANDTGLGSNAKEIFKQAVTWLRAYQPDDSGRRAIDVVAQVRQDLFDRKWQGSECPSLLGQE